MDVRGGENFQGLGDDDAEEGGENEKGCKCGSHCSLRSCGKEFAFAEEGRRMEEKESVHAHVENISH